MLSPFWISTIVFIIISIVAFILSFQFIAPKRTKQEPKIPPRPPGIPYGPPPDPISCMPNDKEFDKLVACKTNEDCGGCISKPGGLPMHCVNVDGTGTGGIDERTGELIQPTLIHYTVPCGNGCRQDPDTKQCLDCECSGHGKKNKHGVCVCDNGFGGNNCELGEFKQDLPGQYCLPAYMGHCNPATSYTVWSADKYGNQQWSCLCKYPSLYTNTVPGGDCDLQLACNHSQPQLDESGKPLLVNAQEVYPNRLTSHSAEYVQDCWYPVVDDGDGTYSGVPESDPTCRPLLNNNVCTYVDVEGKYQILVGSGRPGDPYKESITPFPDPVSCSDTVKTGCLPKGVTKEDCIGQYAQFNFLSEDKKTAKGRRYADWDGQRDGPLLDEETALPYFSPLNKKGEGWGGQCSCDGFVFTLTGQRIPLVPQYRLPLQGEQGWWGCVPDPCWQSKTSSALILNPDQRNNVISDIVGTCWCGNIQASTDDHGKVTGYKSTIHFEGANTGQLPTCINDPCNPGGYYYGGTSGNPLDPIPSCKTNEDCGGKCIEGVCDNPHGVACKGDQDCGIGLCSPSGHCTGRCMCDADLGALWNMKDPTSPIGMSCSLPCKDNPCQHGGTCYIEGGKVKCRCPACTSGDFCDKITGVGKGSPCTPSSCKNGRSNSCCCNGGDAVCEYDPSYQYFTCDK